MSADDRIFTLASWFPEHSLQATSLHSFPETLLLPACLLSSFQWLGCYQSSWLVCCVWNERMSVMMPVASLHAGLYSFLQVLVSLKSGDSLLTCSLSGNCISKHGFSEQINWLIDWFRDWLIQSCSAWSLVTTFHGGFKPCLLQPHWWSGCHLCSL
jgi:hypothetical protein